MGEDSLIHRDTPAKVVLIILNTANMSLFTKIETPSITYDQPTGLYIDGKWVKGTEGKTFETVNPTNENPIVAVHEAGPEDVDIAVKAARKALNGVWGQTLPSARGRRPVVLRLPQILWWMGGQDPRKDHRHRPRDLQLHKTRASWCLRSDYSVELPSAYVGMEDRTCSGHWQHCRPEDC